MERKCEECKGPMTRRLNESARKFRDRQFCSNPCSNRNKGKASLTPGRGPTKPRKPREGVKPKGKLRPALALIAMTEPDLAEAIYEEVTKKHNPRSRETWTSLQTLSLS